MEISVSEAKARLTDLVQRAETGGDVVLTRHGRPAVRLVPVRAAQNAAARRNLLESVRQAGPAQAPAGSSAAASQDFPYGHDGLPH